MTTINMISLSCPVCHTSFQSLAVGSTNTFGPQTTDFYQFNGGTQALPFEVHSCPACGFSAYDEAFSESSPSPEVIDRVNAQIRPLVTDAHVPAERKYEFAAWIASWENKSPFDVAWLYLRAAWCCFLDESGAEERRYRSLAIQWFEQAFREGNIPSNEMMIYCYMIGEQYRRIQDSSNASLWFDRVSGYASDQEDGARWIDLAAQQKSHPKDFLDG